MVEFTLPDSQGHVPFFELAIGEDVEDVDTVVEQAAVIPKVTVCQIVELSVTVWILVT